MAIRAAELHGIPWNRIPHEPFRVSENEPITEDLKSEAKLFSNLGAEAARLLVGTGIHLTDHFRGLYLKGRISLDLLEKCIGELSEGVTELMVHPGRPSRGSGAGPFQSFSTLDREKELESLLSPAFREAVLRARVSLVSFREALL
jgi:predicted glycoside hydrolase/deacetylase ChbG (UPF0249 family)